MNERNDIEFPIWRKKVDQSFLKEKVTPIPKWLWGIWDIENLFGNVTTITDPNSIVGISFERKIYKGNISFSERKSGKICRFSFEENLHSTLKDQFLMTYMRSLEGQIRKSKGNKADIELAIPFWEFIDIEFDSFNKIFKFTCHYNQKPVFPELFKQLVTSPAIKVVDDYLNDKGANRIHKQDWKPRSDYKNEIGAENVIYTLIDTEQKLIYVGEAKKLIARFDSNSHSVIPNWNYYKYNVLPSTLEEHRLAIERMTIRDMASFLANEVDIPNIEISAYKLANRKIDK